MGAVVDGLKVIGLIHVPIIYPFLFVHTLPKMASNAMPAWKPVITRDADGNITEVTGILSGGTITIGGVVVQEKASPEILAALAELQVAETTVFAGSAFPGGDDVVVGGDYNGHGIVNLKGGVYIKGDCTIKTHQRYYVYYWHDTRFLAVYGGYVHAENDRDIIVANMDGELINAKIPSHIGDTQAINMAHGLSTAEVNKLWG